MTNVVKANDLKRAGDFTVDDCRLTLSSGVELDISGVLLEVQLYEDIDTPSVTGTVSFVNTDGLSNRGPIIGQEYLKLKIRTPTFTEEKNINIGNENLVSLKGIIFKIYFYFFGFRHPNPYYPLLFIKMRT